MDESRGNSLLCDEDESCFIESHAEDDEYFHESSESVVLLDLGDEDEYIESLIRKETIRESENYVLPPPLFGYSIDSLSWCGKARLDSIEWILDATTFLGFHNQTAYLAVTYLDRFLARKNIGEQKLWAMRLLSVACLSLAAKMDECHVPALSDFPTRKYKFENRLITRMELLILSTLDWKMSSITPFSYIQFFVDKLVKTSDRKQLLSAANDSVFAVSKEINLVEYRPSTIAAAAVLASSSGQLTKEVVETKMGVVSSWRSLVIEHVFSFCNLMQDIKKKGIDQTPKGRMQSSVDDASVDSSYTSATGNKRRRLQFDAS